MSIRSAESTTAGDGELATQATARESGGNGKFPHLSLRERAARGKAERAEVPRSVHGEWSAPSGRRDPVELLEEQAASRVPELVPIRYGRMLVSPFTFYRGAAYLMAADLAGARRTGLRVQLCGDAHLSNFGGFAAPDRRLVFGINDFDETLPGPFEWDLKRLVASFAVAGRDLGFPVKQRRGVNLAVTRAYREAMQNLASMKTFDLWYSRVDAEALLAQFQSAASAKRRKLMEKIAKTRAKDSLRAFSKLTTIVDGEPRIISDPPLIVPIEDLSEGHDIEAFAPSVNRGYRRTLQGDRKHLLERFRYVHALADFAELYADQNELDYAALSTTVKTGRVTARAIAPQDRSGLGRLATIRRRRQPSPLPMALSLDNGPRAATIDVGRVQCDGRPAAWAASGRFVMGA